MAYIPTPDVVALVRRRYQEGATVKSIAAESGLKNLSIFYRCLAGLYPDGSSIKPAPISQCRAGVHVRHRAGSREALVARMWRTAELQVEEIEERLSAAGLNLAERESGTRMLAVVARTLRELSAVDEARDKRGKETPKDDDDNAMPRNIEDLRRDLSRKLEAFVAGRKIRFLAALNEWQVETFTRSWGIFVHPHQEPPPGDWTTWLVLGGRGAGKTRAGAEWIRLIAQGRSRFGDAPLSPIALIGETEHDAREVMVEGVSGLLAAHQRIERPEWIPSRRRLVWPNGAVAQIFSAEDPESLRGPQFAAAWCDEIAKWRHAEATFDMLQFGLRLGDRPRQVVTTTPRPTALIKRLVADPRTALTRAGTVANAHNLAPAFLDAVVARYVGTRLGRQELDGEIIEERADALWTRAGIESCRVAAAPPLARIVVAVDPPASSGKDADACGLVAAGRGEDGTIYVIADDTVAGLLPAGWSRKAIALWRRLEADALVVEVNQGGDMVRAVIGEADPSVPVVAVRARKGKWLRAEPVSALYDQGKVRHAGAFPALEDEMCDFGLDGLSSGRSPDRVDALVWAVTALTFGALKDGPRVRGL